MCNNISYVLQIDVLNHSFWWPVSYVSFAHMSQVEIKHEQQLYTEINYADTDVYDFVIYSTLWADSTQALYSLNKLFVLWKQSSPHTYCISLMLSTAYLSVRSKEKHWMCSTYGDPQREQLL